MSGPIEVPDDLSALLPEGVPAPAAEAVEHFRSWSMHMGIENYRKGMQDGLTAAADAMLASCPEHLERDLVVQMLRVIAETAGQKIEEQILARRGR